MIKRWNETVAPKDIVYIIGDFSMRKSDLHFAQKLNGYKILISGNHDYSHPLFEKKQTKSLYLKYFNEVHDTLIISKKKLGDSGDELVMLSHFPSEDGKAKHGMYKKYSKWRPVFTGLIICGHVHGAWLKKNNNINVGVDCWDFKPIPFYKIWDLYRSDSNFVPVNKKWTNKLWKFYHTILIKSRKIFHKVINILRRNFIFINKFGVNHGANRGDSAKSSNDKL